MNFKDELINIRLEQIKSVCREAMKQGKYEVEFNSNEADYNDLLILEEKEGLKLETKIIKDELYNETTYILSWY